MKLYIRQPSASTNQRKPTKNIDMGKQTNAHAFTSKPIHQSNGEQRATYSPATNTRPKQAKHPNTADAPPAHKHKRSHKHTQTNTTTPTHGQDGRRQREEERKRRNSHTTAHTHKQTHMSMSVSAKAVKAESGPKVQMPGSRLKVALALARRRKTPMSWRCCLSATAASMPH